ncbi:MAG: aldose 1-epimerase family protein [Ferruginibacter sp.]
MKYNLENSNLAIEVNTNGAELQRLFNKQNGIEHLWSGDPAYWGKFSPVLFPIVGALKENAYLYKGTGYHLPRHGFAREKEFTLTGKTEDELCFLLDAGEETLKFYPFQFSLEISYRLHQNSMLCNYTVQNKGEDLMPFSLGAHPAFALPFLPGTGFGDYFLRFDNDESIIRWKLNDAGLISNESVKIELENNELNLHHRLFAEDAIVIKDLRSGSIRLSDSENTHGFHFAFSNFPFFGIWSAKNAPFICLEPWQGIADASDHNQDILQKEGIVLLPPGQSWNAGWTVNCF